MFRRSFWIVFFLSVASGVAAQSLASAPDRAFFDVNSSFSVADNFFTETWNPSPVIHLNLRFPFYAGQVESGARYIRFKGDAPTPTDSDFHSIFVHLGWSYPIDITARYQIAPVLLFGNNIMLFDESEVFTNQSGTEMFVTDKNENEFAYELALRNQFQISSDWFIHATISYNRTLTFFPLSVTLVSAGVSYSFDTPRWLKKAFK